jgi:hypothetical protein
MLTKRSGCQNGGDQQLAAHDSAFICSDACESIASGGSGKQSLEAEPLANNCGNCVHLIRRQSVKAAHQLRMRDRDDVLRIKDARFQKSGRNSDLEIGSPRARCVSDNCHEHTIVGPSRRNAKNQAWPDLCDHAEVD